MTRRGVWLAAVVAITTAAAGAGSTYAVLSARERTADRPATLEPRFTTDEVTRRTLTTTGSVDGELTRGAGEPLFAKAAGTLTWLPPVGAVLRRGDTVLRADERPVVLLYGRLPMYRPLALDTEGDDVEQFERNLAALGYRGFTVDQKFSEATVAAVKRWQADLQAPPTGTVDVAAVTYVSRRIRVAEHTARLGAAAAGQVLTCTPDTKMVTAQVPASAAGWAVPDTEVRVALPNGRTAAGVVESVGTTATTAGSDGGENGGDTPPAAGANTATVTVTVTIADQKAIGRLESGPVQIRHTVKERRDVLTVSVAALVAPIEGGYAVEVGDGAGWRLVPVTTGLFADGRVEIKGSGITEGTPVRVPS